MNLKHDFIILLNPILRHSHTIGADCHLPFFIVILINEKIFIEQKLKTESIRNWLDQIYSKKCQ